MTAGVAARAPTTATTGTLPTAHTPLELETRGLSESSQRYINSVLDTIKDPRFQHLVDLKLSLDPNTMKGPGPDYSEDDIDARDVERVVLAHASRKPTAVSVYRRPSDRRLVTKIDYA
jgi:hypothetical protein